MREKRMRMNKKMSVLMVVLAGAVMAGLTADALAVPYASGISESGTVVTYFLNEDADSITVKRDVGGDLVLTGGDLLKGSHTFNLDTAGTGYDIEVSKSAAVGWTQYSDDALIQSQYYSPMGVAVNQNPDSPHFGNIYVSEGRGWTTASGRDTFDGIYLMGADQSDIKNQGDIPATGGVSWLVGDGFDPDTNNRNSPFKLTIAPDNSLYIADWSDGHSGVWRAPADLDETTAWPNILADETNVNDGTGGLYDNHGSISSVWVEGTGAGTKLYTIDEDFPDRGDINRYDIGTTVNYTGAPVKQVTDGTNVILNALSDVVRDEDGSWWISQNRSDDSLGVPVLTHWADGGAEPLWTSGKSAREVGDFDWDSDVDGTDFLTWQVGTAIIDGTADVWDGDADGDTYVDGVDLALWQDNFGKSIPGELVLDEVFGNVDIHDDLDLLLLGGRSGGTGVYVVDISDPNAPVISAIIPQSGWTRDVAFDIAGNAYIASSSSETLRIWSPGGDWIATTKSDGTFVLSPPPAAAVAVPEPGSLLLVALGLACLAGGRFTSRRL